MAINREINYLNKDFAGFRADLLNYAQAYFPPTYTDVYGNGSICWRCDVVLS